MLLQNNKAFEEAIFKTNLRNSAKVIFSLDLSINSIPEQMISQPHHPRNADIGSFILLQNYFSSSLGA